MPIDTKNVTKDKAQDLLYDPETLIQNATKLKPVNKKNKNDDVDETNETEKPIASEEEVQDMKDQLKRWLQLDDQVRTLSIAIRERKCAQAALSPKIQDFMIKYGYNDVNAQDGTKIKSVVRNVKQQPKMKDIKQKILEQQGEEVLNTIFTEPEIIEKYSIKRVIPKISMSLEL